MIIILTGPVNSGKTTFLKTLIPELTRRSIPVHGFLSSRVVTKNKTTGYDLFDIQSQKTLPYLRTDAKEGWEKIGSYYFVPETLEKAKNIIDKHPIGDWLVVDEIGPLELKGKGLWPALTRILSNRDLHILCVVRKAILPDILRLTAIPKSHILEIQDKNLLDKTIKMLTELDHSLSD